MAGLFVPIIQWSQYLCTKIFEDCHFVPHSVCQSVQQSSMAAILFSEFCYICTFIYVFLGTKAPLQPTSSEGLYVCMSVCNILTPLPSPPLEKRDKETKRQRD